MKIHFLFLLASLSIVQAADVQKDDFLFTTKAVPSATATGVVDIEFTLKYLGKLPIQIGFEMPIYEYCTFDVPQGWESRWVEGAVSYITESREPKVLKSGESIAESAPLRKYFIKIAPGEFALHAVLSVPLGDNDQVPKLVLKTELQLKISDEQAAAFNRAEKEEAEALRRHRSRGK